MQCFDQCHSLLNESIKKYNDKQILIDAKLIRISMYQTYLYILYILFIIYMFIFICIYFCL